MESRNHQLQYYQRDCRSSKRKEKGKTESAAGGSNTNSTCTCNAAANNAAPAKPAGGTLLRDTTPLPLNDPRPYNLIPDAANRQKMRTSEFAKIEGRREIVSTELGGG